MNGSNVKFGNFSCTLIWQSHWKPGMRKSQSAVQCTEKYAWLDRLGTSRST